MLTTFQPTAKQAIFSWVNRCATKILLRGRGAKLKWTSQMGICPKSFLLCVWRAISYLGTISVFCLCVCDFLRLKLHGKEEGESPLLVAPLLRTFWIFTKSSKIFPESKQLFTVENERENVFSSKRQVNSLGFVFLLKLVMSLSALFNPLLMIIYFFLFP